MKILHVSKIVGENSKYNSWHSQSFWHHIMFMCSFCWEFIGNYFRYLKGKTTFGVKKWKYKVKNSFTWKWSELSEYLCQMDTGYLLENWWECSPDFLREKKKELLTTRYLDPSSRSAPYLSIPLHSSISLRLSSQVFLKKKKNLRVLSSYSDFLKM